MRNLAITAYFESIKQEPVFEAEAFNLNTSLECTSTKIKNEQQCYVKEEIDIPDSINLDCDSLCIKPGSNLDNRTCSIIINRLSDAVLQKYLKNENQSEEIIGRPDRLDKDKMENSATKNQQTETIKKYKKMDKIQKEIVQYSGEKKVRIQGKTDITTFFTSLSEETIPLLKSFDANNRQNKNIESNDKKDGKKRCIRYSSKDGPLSTEFYRSFCPKCEKNCKTRTATVRCSDCKSRLMYECNKCRKQLGSHAGMGNHVRGSCMSQGYYYECFKCGFRSPLRYYVSRHLRRVHPNSFFPERIKRIASKEIRTEVAPEIDECSKCGQQFSALSTLVKHVQICNDSKDSEEHTTDYAASKNKILRYCSKCDETIKNAITHKKKLCEKCQSELAFKCSICQKLYNSCFGATNHIVNIHTEKEWRCYKCDFKSGSITSLTAHYRRMHNPKVFECTKCRTTWKSREHLARHLKKCGVKRHLHCAHCSYKTAVRSHLRTHIVYVHSQDDRSEDQSVACPKCQKICRNDVFLKRHLNITCEKEAKFQCEHCSFKTKFKCSIERHILRYHWTGIK